MNEVYEATEEDVQHLRGWLKKMPHIPQNYDDVMLKSFFRASKGSLQRTKLVLENYCSLGQRCPELFANLDPLSDSALAHMKTAKCFPLPKKTKDDCSVLISMLNREEHDPMDYSFTEAFRSILYIIKTYALEDNLGSGKMIVVMDFRGIKLAHVRDMTPTTLRTIWDSIQTSLPMRLQGLHGVTLTPSVEWMFGLFKSVAPAKMAQRLHAHGEVEGIYDHVPREILPKDFGGEDESSEILFKKWRERLERHRDEIVQEDRRLRALDHSRPRAKKLDGMTGSFKKLNID